MKKKILIVANVQMHLFLFRRSLADELMANDYEVIFLAAEDEYGAKLAAMGYSTHVIKNLNRDGKSIFKDFFLLLEFYFTIKKIKPSFVFFYTIKPNLYGSIVAKWLNIPFIMTINGLGQMIENKKLFPILKQIYKIACRFSKTTIFQNADDLNYFVENNLIEKNKAVLVNGSGIDVEAYQPKNNFQKNATEKFSFVLIARLLWQKGIREFVDAATIIKQKYPQAKFILIGSLEENEQNGVTKSIMDEWLKNDVIEYLGWQNDTKKLIENADVVVLPSYYREGIPRTLIEATALGKPIITANSVGCKETVMDNFNGFLVAPKSTEELVVAFEKMLKADKNLLQKFSNNSRKIAVEKFDVKKVNAVYLAQIETQ